MILEIVGFIGTLVSAFSYVPQIRHIIKEHCSGGVSLRSWGVALLATVLIFSYAITTDDLVFKTLQVVHLVAIISTIILIKRYSPRVCHSKESVIKSRKKKK